MAPVNYISDTAKLGKNVTVWHYAYIGDNTIIGDNVSIGSLVHIDYDVRIGDNTRIAGQAHIATLSRIGKNVFIGPMIVITNDPYPPGKKLAGVTIKDNAIIGGGAMFRAGVTIGSNSVVAMGALVTKDVPDNTVVAGAPATILYSRAEYDKRQKEWSG
ncbi:MAG: N-acetyltransferase [Nitrosopumilus sp. H8]|nr:MAG: N-acetyltransferase [Nitrosopumilus sp. H8]